MQHRSLQSKPCAHCDPYACLSLHISPSSASSIAGTCNLITDAVSGLYGRSAGADDVLPLLVLVIVEARILYFATEMMIIDTLLLEDLKDGELGYFSACGKAALGRITAVSKQSKVLLTPRDLEDLEL